MNQRLFQINELASLLKTKNLEEAQEIFACAFDFLLYMNPEELLVTNNVKFHKVSSDLIQVTPLSGSENVRDLLREKTIFKIPV